MLVDDRLFYVIKKCCETCIHSEPAQNGLFPMPPRLLCSLVYETDGRFKSYKQIYYTSCCDSYGKKK